MLGTWGFALVYTVACSVIALLVWAGSASAQDPPPSRFAGNAYVGGALAENGVVVEVLSGEEVVASAVVRKLSAGVNYVVDVVQPEGDGLLSFRVGGLPVPGVSAEWTQGASVFPFDLRASEAAAVPATAVPASTPVAGPRGTRGERGPAGPRGEAGPAGPVGPLGPRGPVGDRGPVGPPGIPGAEGPRGIPGNDGLDGVRGNDGPPGTAGAAGAAGEIGPEGPEGPAGAAGPEGRRGPRGEAGEPGGGGGGGLGALAGWAALAGVAVLWVVYLYGRGRRLPWESPGGGESG